MFKKLFSPHKNSDARSEAKLPISNGMSTLKTRIMNRVYAIYVLRQLSQPAVKLGAFLALLLALRELTFVSKVVENASLKNDAFEFANYMLYAFSGTELIVQLVVVSVLALVAFMLKDALALVRPQRLAV